MSEDIVEFCSSNKSKAGELEQKFKDSKATLAKPQWGDKHPFF